MESILTMIICICRNIKDSDYSSKEELLNRLSQSDINCGQCQKYVTANLNMNKLSNTQIIKYSYES